MTKNDIENAYVVDYLQHYQYWDKNDCWDLDSVNINILLKDGECLKVPINNEVISYRCVPEKPDDVSSENNQLTIANIKIKVQDGVYVVQNHIFEVITVPAPEKTTVTSGGLIICIVPLVFTLCLLFVKKRLNYEKK